MDSQNIIYCIGDSHVSFFSGQDKMQLPWPHKSNDRLAFFKTFRLGAVLADSLSKYGSSMKGRELLFVLLDRRMPMVEFRSIPPKSKVLFCFGEIDCRFHILKQSIQRDVEVEVVVEETVNKYVNVLKEFQALEYEILVWNVIPPTNPAKTNPEYPHYGKYSERIKATMLFNNFLKKKCTDFKFNFIDIYDQLIEKNYHANMNYYMDEIHLSQKAMSFTIDSLQKIYPDIFNYKGSPQVSFIKKMLGK